MPDFTYDVGRVSFIMKGAWNLATNYEKLDAVTHDGSLYIAKQNVPGGTAITNTTYWQLAAEKGDKGDTGGVDSVNGQQGDIWFPDSRQLISDGYTTDTDPFLMKGNDSDSDRFELAKKLGNTVVVNQLIPIPATDLSQTNNGVTLTDNRDGTYTLSGTATGQALFFIFYRFDSALTLGRKYIFFGMPGVSGIDLWDSFSATVSTNSSAIMSYDTTSTIDLALRVSNGTVCNNVKVEPKCSGLTLWFGSNDRIPSDLLSHPENWGRYYAGSLTSNAGTLESADGSILTSIHRNIWDEEWEVGAYNVNTGAKVADNARIRSKNLMSVIPNTQYYFYFGYNIGSYGFAAIWYDADGNYISGAIKYGNTQTSPANAHFCAFYTQPQYGTTYNHDITPSLYYPGESGYDQYYPHSVLAEVDTGSEVLRSAGSVADEKTPDGTITRRVGVVDLSTLAWSWSNTSAGRKFWYATLTGVKGTTDTTSLPHLGSSKYVLLAPGLLSWYSDTDDCVTLAPNGTSTIRVISDNSPTGTLTYELATPTTEQGTAFAPIVATVKNGVLSWTNTKGIPVGHESHYFENLRKRVEDRLPDPPSGDGTYRLTCTISGGVKTYSWEA